MHRRRYLAFVSSGLTVGLAGCSGSGGDGGSGGGPTGSTTDTGEAGTTGAGGATATGADGATTTGNTGAGTDTDTPTDTGGTATGEMTERGASQQTTSSLSPDENAQELVVQFYRYLDAGNTDAAANLVHPESPLREGSGPLFSDTESVRAMETNDVMVRSVSRLPWRYSNDSSRAVLEALVSLSEESEASTIQWEVQKANGNWRIWAQAQPQSESG